MQALQEKAGLWLRVSSGGQDEANQRPDLDRYCAQHGYEAARTYEVHGRSAYHGKHQGYLDAALADMRAGIIKVLVIWHSDRIERRPGKALLDVLAEFTAAGGRVESVQEPTLGSLDFGGQVVTFVAGLVNHEKSAHLSQQVKLGHNRSRANGALTGRPPFGYTTTGEKYNRRMIPTAEGKQYVPQMFDRVIQGDSLGTIAGWLNGEGVPAPGGGRWWPKTVGSIIRNPSYMGRRRDAGSITVHRCPALVDAATFKRAGEALDHRPKRGPQVAENRAMLAGALRCPRCAGDSPMYRIMTGYPPRQIAYYRCAGRGAQRKGCGNLVRCEQADAAMEKIARTTFYAKVKVRKVIPGHNYEAELEDIRQELRELPARDLPDAEHDIELARLRAERDRLAALPSVPDKVKLVPTGERYRDLWKALPVSERGAWLVRQGFRVEATRDELTLSQPGHPNQLTATVPLRADAVTQS